MVLSSSVIIDTPPSVIPIMMLSISVCSSLPTLSILSTRMKSPLAIVLSLIDSSINPNPCFRWSPLNALLALSIGFRFDLSTSGWLLNQVSIRAYWRSRLEPFDCTSDENL